MPASIRTVALLPILLFSLAAVAADAPPTSASSASTPAGKPQCRTAVLNPVTRYAECVDPPGAPVAQIPRDVEPPCPKHSAPTGGFDIHTRCKAEAPPPK